MGWQFWRRGGRSADESSGTDAPSGDTPLETTVDTSTSEATAATGDAAASASSTSSAPSGPVFRAPARTGAWATLPPIARVVDMPTPFTSNPLFQRELRTHQDMSVSTAPLAHAVSPSGPSGTVGGLMTTLGAETAGAQEPALSSGPDLVLRPVQRAVGDESAVAWRPGPAPVAVPAGSLTGGSTASPPIARAVDTGAAATVPSAAPPGVSSAASQAASPASSSAVPPAAESATGPAPASPPPVVPAAADLPLQRRAEGTPATGTSPSPRSAAPASSGFPAAPPSAGEAVTGALSDAPSPMAPSEAAASTVPAAPSVPVSSAASAGPAGRILRTADTGESAASAGPAGRILRTADTGESAPATGSGAPPPVSLTLAPPVRREAPSVEYVPRAPASAAAVQRSLAGAAPVPAVAPTAVPSAASAPGPAPTTATAESSAAADLSLRPRRIAYEVTSSDAPLPGASIQRSVEEPAAPASAAGSTARPGLGSPLPTAGPVVAAPAATGPDAGDDALPLAVQRVADDGVFGRPAREARRAGLGQPLAQLPPTAAPIARLTEDEDWDEPTTGRRDAAAPAGGPTDLPLAPRPPVARSADDGVPDDEVVDEPGAVAPSGGASAPTLGQVPAPVVFRAADVPLPVVQARSAVTAPAGGADAPALLLRRSDPGATSAPVPAAGPSTATGHPPVAPAPIQRTVAGTVADAETVQADLTPGGGSGAGAEGEEGPDTASQPLVGDRPVARRIDRSVDVAAGDDGEGGDADQATVGGPPLRASGAEAAADAGTPLPLPLAPVGRAVDEEDAAGGGEVGAVERVVQRSVDAPGGSTALSPLATGETVPAPAVAGPMSTGVAPLLPLRPVAPVSTSGGVVSRMADQPPGTTAVPVHYPGALAPAPTGGGAGAAAGTAGAEPTPSAPVVGAGASASIARRAETTAPAVPLGGPAPARGPVAVLHRSVGSESDAPGAATAAPGALGLAPTAPLLPDPGGSTVSGAAGGSPGGGEWAPGGLPLAIQRRVEGQGASSASPATAPGDAGGSGVGGGNTASGAASPEPGPIPGNVVLRSPDYGMLQRDSDDGAGAQTIQREATGGGGGGDGGGGGGGGDAGALKEEEFEKQVDKLYERIRYRLRRELLNERERAGFSLDKIR